MRGDASCLRQNAAEHAKSSPKAARLWPSLSLGLSLFTSSPRVVTHLLFTLSVSLPCSLFLSLSLSLSIYVPLFVAEKMLTWFS